eukprot:5081888-Amphidinium_carterae.1
MGTSSAGDARRVTQSALWRATSARRGKRCMAASLRSAVTVLWALTAHDFATWPRLHRKRGIFGCSEVALKVDELEERPVKLSVEERSAVHWWQLIQISDHDHTYAAEGGAVVAPEQLEMRVYGLQHLRGYHGALIDDERRAGRPSSR